MVKHRALTASVIDSRDFLQARRLHAGQNHVDRRNDLIALIRRRRDLGAKGGPRNGGDEVRRHDMSRAAHPQRRCDRATGRPKSASGISGTTTRVARSDNSSACTSSSNGAAPREAPGFP